MTKIAIVEDNKVIRESLIEFVQADPECSCVCACATAEEARVRKTREVMNKGRMLVEQSLRR